jgi:hypothetical protein
MCRRVSRRWPVCYMPIVMTRRRRMTASRMRYRMTLGLQGPAAVVVDLAEERGVVLMRSHSALGQVARRRVGAAVAAGGCSVTHWRGTAARGEEVGKEEGLA